MLCALDVLVTTFVTAIKFQHRCCTTIFYDSVLPPTTILRRPASLWRTNLQNGMKGSLADALLWGRTERYIFKKWTYCCLMHHHQPTGQHFSTFYYRFKIISRWGHKQARQRDRRQSIAVAKCAEKCSEVWCAVNSIDKETRKVQGTMESELIFVLCHPTTISRPYRPPSFFGAMVDPTIFFELSIANYNSNTTYNFFCSWRRSGDRKISYQNHVHKSKHTSSAQHPHHTVLFVVL